jgi:hypothetical protein
MLWLPHFHSSGVLKSKFTWLFAIQSVAFVRGIGVPAIVAVSHSVYSYVYVHTVSGILLTMVPDVYLAIRRYGFQSLYYAIILIFLSWK